MIRKCRLILIIIGLILTFILAAVQFNRWSNPSKPFDKFEFLPNDKRDSVYKLSENWDTYRLELHNFINDHFPDSIKSEHLNHLHSQVGKPPYESNLNSKPPFIDPQESRLPSKSCIKSIMQTAKKDDPKRNSFIEKNPGWTRTFLNNKDADEWSNRTFGNSDLFNIWQEMRKPVLKSDLLRYAWVYFNGGVYSDFDTDCDIPISQWQSEVEPFYIQTSQDQQISISNDQSSNVIIGFEIQAHLSRDWPKWFARPVQFIQSTFASLSPHHPIFLDCLRRIYLEMQPVIQWYNDHEEDFQKLKAKGASQAELDKAFDPFFGDNEIFDVLEVTGPGLSTDAIMSYFRAKYGLDWRDFAEVKGSIHIDDITILPVAAFNQNSRGSRDAPGVFVWHYFNGSWRKPQAEATEDD